MQPKVEAVAIDAAAAEDTTPAKPPYPPVLGGGVLEDMNPAPNVVEVSLTASKQRISLYDGNELTMMTYNGQFPGPLLEAKVGDEIIVHFTNELDEPTTIHWHGLRIADNMDGSPRVQVPVPAKGSFEYRFVVPDAGSFWYHPHVRANEQVESGLYGPLVVHDTKDPEYDRERYLVLDDILLDRAGRLVAPFKGGFPEKMHGRVGNVFLTNGKQSDLARAEAAQGDVERWRIVNTSNARTMQLELKGAAFRVIGTDGGLLREPFTTKRLAVAVGQRYDLEVTYDAPGTATFSTYSLFRDPAGEIKESATAAFTVDVTASDKAARAIEWPSFLDEAERKADQEVTLEFDVVQSPDGAVEWRINGMAHKMDGHHMDPLFTFPKGRVVKMRLTNKAGPEHPFHLHGQFFEILSRKEPGFKDTALVPGLSTVEILARFDNPGKWMAHCHILEHAELGMMTEIVVTP